jgi:cupin fold WbuC family metalloprotein
MDNNVISEKIYSVVSPETILHMIVRKNNVVKGRVDIVPEENFIQCSLLNLDKGKTFKPHKHIWKERTNNVIAQESWVVIKGSVKCIFYDIDDTLLSEHILYEGDSSFTLQGGHNYVILEDDTIVYEYKTGPYEGQEFDKKFI